MKERRWLLLQLGRVSLHANITVLFWGQLLFLSSPVLGHIWQMCKGTDLSFPVPCAVFGAPRVGLWHARQGAVCTGGDRGSPASEARGMRVGSKGALT